ncbi:hypothetical protein [Salinibacillus xinjiangensis]|uniref:Uncharacterized protein n=1 Tax=Salinibacillus xinjiangensis TaxID=1229268 RepID=A0A6G1X8P3_9BACI|nr:hypothetical protein [Salinibacillus xinjiangensis]MRG87312.1 hypothetical protein [Salinibacillus xinjiangensis]
MMKFVIGYFIIQIVLLIVILLITNKTDKKSHRKYYRPNEVPEGYVKTSESFIDTKTKNVIVVYYNKTTGKRIYVEQ